MCCSYLECLPWETQRRCRPSPQSPLAPLPVSFPTIPFAVIAAAAPSPALQNMPAQLRPACRLERAPLYWKIYEGGDKREEGEAGREAEGGREEPGAVMGVIRKPDPPLGFKGNGISRQRVSISPGILHVRVPFEQKKKKKKNFKPGTSWRICPACMHY